MTFPVTVGHKGQRAKIYRPAKDFPFYRISFKSAGKRKMLTFSSYGDAKTAAEEKLREIHKGQQSAGLTAKESQDAINIREMLSAYRRETGRQLSALEAVSTCIAATKLLQPGSTLLEAVNVYSRTLANVKPKTITEAISEFINSRKCKETNPGERARLSPVYARNVETWLSKFSGTFPGHLVSDLLPDLIEKYLAQFSNLSAKARNDRRVTVGMWLRWTGRKDYVEPHQLQKLLECDVMQMEPLLDARIEFYAPGELLKILGASEGALRAVTALQALGGARLEEALRLRWEDLHRTPGYIEISGQHAKTRRRRLLEVGPTLARRKPARFQPQKIPTFWNQS